MSVCSLVQADIGLRNIYALIYRCNIFCCKLKGHLAGENHVSTNTLYNFKYHRLEKKRIRFLLSNTYIEFKFIYTM